MAKNVQQLKKRLEHMSVAHEIKKKTLNYRPVSLTSIVSKICEMASRK